VLEGCRHQLLEALEAALDVMAIQQFLPLQPGDVPATTSDLPVFEAWTGFRPSTPVAEGVARFAAWYRQYDCN
jgi:UDP-glucuronate 4-epimerase